MSEPDLHSIIFECFNGVDIAAKDFTAAKLKAGANAKPKLAPRAFSQNAEGFEKYLWWLLALSERESCG